VYGDGGVPYILSLGEIRNADVICDACGGKGHPASQCWPLAKELQLTNFIPDKKNCDIILAVKDALHEKNKSGNPRVGSDNRKEGFAKNFGNARKMTDRQLADELDY
jgi:hypothetical protein